MLHCLVLLARQVHRVFLDVQVTQDKDLQDRLDLPASQVMEDQDLKEIGETRALHPTQEQFIKDHLDHQGSQDLLDAQDLRGPEGTLELLGFQALQE